MRDRQTTAVQGAAIKRTAHAEARVRKALSAIATSGAEVNFVAVATAARVSRQFLCGVLSPKQHPAAAA